MEEILKCFEIFFYNLWKNYGYVDWKTNYKQGYFESWILIG